MNETGTSRNAWLYAITVILREHRAIERGQRVLGGLERVGGGTHEAGLGYGQPVPKPVRAEGLPLRPGPVVRAP